MKDEIKFGFTLDIVLLFIKIRILKSIWKESGRGTSAQKSIAHESETWHFYGLAWSDVKNSILEMVIV